MIRYFKALMGIYDHKWTNGPSDISGLELVKVANDLHIGSDYQDNPDSMAEVVMLENDGRTVLNGDIVDLACCPEENSKMLLIFFHGLKAKFQDFYELGNHERMGVEEKKPLIITLNSNKRYLFEHGDMLSNPKKWGPYRSKKHGSSKGGRLITRILDNLDHVKAMRPLPKNFIEKAAEKCIQLHCDGAVFGHFHVEKERRYLYNGKQIIILPAHKINQLWL